MPRVSDEEIIMQLEAIERTLGRSLSINFHRQRLNILLDLQDARAALEAILNWKHRTTDEAPLTFIERKAKEVVG